MQGRPRAARAAKNGGRNSKHSKPKVAKFNNYDQIPQFCLYWTILALWQRVNKFCWGSLPFYSTILPHIRLRSYQNFKATNPVKVSMMQVFWQFCGQYNVSWNDKGGDKYLSWKSFHISGFTLTAFTFDTDVCLLCINTLSCILRIRRLLISVGDEKFKFSFGHCPNYLSPPD